MQRGGTYSVVPRVPGGELTPEQLIRMGEVAKEYGLYSKVTGAQRIDLFGAPKYQLPDVSSTPYCAILAIKPLTP
jgi:nitrite reductase (NADH) large subunit